MEVLGHIFEKSIGELERLRRGGLFEDPGAATAAAGHAEIGRTETLRHLLHAARVHPLPRPQDRLDADRGSGARRSEPPTA